MNYSDDQLDIFDKLVNTNHNICVQATAGAGKTTTLLECLNRIPKVSKSLFCSLTNTIVTELRERVPRHITASTLHSLGWAMIRNYYVKSGVKSSYIKVVPEKYQYAAIALYDTGLKPMTKDDFKNAYRVADICTYARLTLTPQNVESFMEMSAYYNLECDPALMENALVLLKDSLKTPKTVDFADMIYYPAKLGYLVNEQYKFIFLDEAQDINKAQLTMLERMIAPKGRLIAVGDRYQSIYSFTGSSVDSFEKLQQRENTITLPLSTSYRCPKKVVEAAQEVNSDIKAYEFAREGDVRSGHFTDIQEGDMVLSRVTKPLIELYFQLIERDIKARVYGKDIEQGLAALAESCMSASKEGVIYNIRLKIGELEDKLLARHVQKITEHREYRSLDEKFQLITLILLKIETTKELLPKIKEIFSEDRNACKLMTIHRSKGLENKRVFLITKYNDQPLMPSKWATQSWEFVQENNLKFVALTRAQEELVYIDLKEA